MKTNIIQEQYLAHVLREVTKKGNDKLVNEAVKTVAAALKKSKRAGMAESVIREYRRVLIKNNMASEMIVESAEVLPETLQNKIKEAQSIDKQVTVKNRIKPELIGGAVVQYRDTRWDFSVQHRVRQLEKKLLNT